MSMITHDYAQVCRGDTYMGVTVTCYARDVTRRVRQARGRRNPSSSLESDHHLSFLPFSQFFH
jgi:hypothetical protein